MRGHHIRGPWRTFAEAGHESVVGKDDELVADCMVVGKGRRASVNRANARLAAAALDMRDAIADVLDHIAETGSALNDDVVVDLLKAAKAKAEGRME